MPDSAVLTFTNLDAYQRPLRGAQAQGVVSARHLATCGAPYGPERPPGNFPEAIPMGWDEQVQNARDAPAHRRSGRSDEIGC
jgi:hypothetical protein